MGFLMLFCGVFFEERCGGLGYFKKNLLLFLGFFKSLFRSLEASSNLPAALLVFPVFMLLWAGFSHISAHPVGRRARCLHPFRYRLKTWGFFAPEAHICMRRG